MARPREYRIEDVLQNAMTVFWRRGFVATSMSEIYAATGLKPGNLYATFTDKDTLFRRAFETYTEHFRATLPRDAEGAAAIESWLRTQARLATEDPDRKGCLIVNTMTEREAHAPETRDLARARLQEITTFFRHHLGLARMRGEIDPSGDPEAQAPALTGAVVAIMSLARAGSAAQMIHDIADQAVIGLRPRATGAPPA